MTILRKMLLWCWFKLRPWWIKLLRVREQVSMVILEGKAWYSRSRIRVMMAVLESLDPWFRANVESEIRQRVRLLTERVFLVRMRGETAQAVAAYLDRDPRFSELVPNKVRIVPPLFVAEKHLEIRFVSCEGVTDEHQANLRLAQHGCRPAQLQEAVAFLEEHHELDDEIVLVITGTHFDWASIVEKCFPCFVWGLKEGRWVLNQTTFDELSKLYSFPFPSFVLVGVRENDVVSSVA